MLLKLSSKCYVDSAAEIYLYGAGQCDAEGDVAVLQAEDMAIEECLEVLQDALKGRAAGLEVVMRLGRELAQKQFYCRAVGAKLQQKQRERHAAGSQRDQAGPQAGVLLPMGDAWSRISTYQG